MKFGESMYKATQGAEGGPHDPSAGGPGAGPHGGSHPGHDDKVVDADFEEVDEKKRGQA
jgi:molecular chaperone DnaK